MLLEDDGDACGRCHLLEGIVQALLSCLMSNRGKPRLSLMVQAMHRTLVATIAAAA
jgi:hypothetical protein